MRVSHNILALSLPSHRSQTYANNQCKKACGKCGSSGGSSAATSAPATTQSPTCKDKYSNCPELAKTACYQDHIKEGCPKSCGTCPGENGLWLTVSFLFPGMTPAASLTCFDTYNNCSELCR